MIKKVVILGDLSDFPNISSIVIHCATMCLVTDANFIGFQQIRRSLYKTKEYKTIGNQ